MAGTRTELQMIKMSEIQSQEVAWLWFPFIPYGKLTIVQGDPGDGKTTLVLNIAAKLSKGEGLDSKMKLTEPLNVIYQSAEDGLADTVKPRLEAAGANCENISVIDESIKSLSIAVFFVEFSLCAAGKIPFYFFPDISLVVELYLDMFRLFGEAVSPYLGSNGINDGTIACIYFLSPRPQIQDAI